MLGSRNIPPIKTSIENILHRLSHELDIIEENMEIRRE